MKCNLCPRKCNAEREMNPDACQGRQKPATAGTGFCGESSVIRISRAALHFWEEPCISGVCGSGAVFFTGCNLKCIYCQNAAISEDGNGHEVTPAELADIFFDLKKQGAHNINLVTPSHFVPGIRDAILIAKERGFDLPFVYNTSAYETVEALRTLDGLIDIYLPDFKYIDPVMAGNYSRATDYPAVAKAAIAEMMRQVPFPVFSEYTPGLQTAELQNADSGNENTPKPAYNGPVSLIRKGVIIRHLVLPLGTKNSVSVIDYLAKTYGKGVYLSVMSQYTPLYNVPGALSEAQKKRLAAFPALHRKITKREYDKVIQHCMDLGMDNIFIQEGNVAKESFIPPFPTR